MTKHCLYFAAFLLMLSLNWRTSSGRPVQDLDNDGAQCVLLSKNLLDNIKDSLQNDTLCHGLNDSKMTVWRSEDAVLNCVPNLTQGSICVTQRNSSFNESECRRNIVKDLSYYNATIQHYLLTDLNMPEKEIPLLKPSLGTIQTLLKNCFLMADIENNSFQADAAELWGKRSFNNRQKMCQMMRGFYTRVITINRAVRYILSGDHRE